ncbi:alkaline phosphatase family protein [Methylomicrobium lacus]|uniref:alkaline phosphatase family protein n=1 Tax=Methylomicrobium lacus TaxID=136992 RepID=UPI0035A90D18
MKYLLIGIDGCQEEHFYRFDMPFMQGMFSQGQKVDLTEDLISRGWAEICTGLHATDSGAYYERAVMNGTHEWTTSYNLLAEKKNNTSIPTLWEVLNSQGYSVGIMNVPTTNPAPEINGFFVSGGGGGRKVEDEVDPSQCHPKSIKEKLDSLGYISDERISSLLFEKNLYEEKDFFARLQLMTEKRIESYLALNKEFDVDFGFVVFRSVVVLENIFSSEIAKYLAGDIHTNKILIDHIKAFYSHLDSCIEKLCVGLGVDKIGFVSDHGTVLQKYSVNLNVFLLENKFQQKTGSKEGLLWFLKKYKDLIPYQLRAKLKKSRSVLETYQGIQGFDKQKSLAFTSGKGTSFFGIYVNDTKRFGGCVPEDKIEDIANQIVNTFNSNSEAKKHGFSAVSEIHRRTGAYAKYWPDILVNVPSGYNPDNNQNLFVAPFSRSHESIQLKEVKSDLWTGTKDKVPLSLFVGHTHLHPDMYVQQDLTAVFRIVKAEFGL